MPPDHSTISRTRRLIDVETHQAVFRWVLQLLAEKGLLKGKTVGIDATTLEANAALHSIVRRETGEDYQEFLRRLAQESGIATPTREQLAKLDRKRAHKGSNEDWVNPHDPEAGITKLKDGRTHLAYKAEHAVDLETGAVVAVTVATGDAATRQRSWKPFPRRVSTSPRSPAPLIMKRWANGCTRKDRSRRSPTRDTTAMTPCRRSARQSFGPISPNLIVGSVIGRTNQKRGRRCTTTGAGFVASMANSCCAGAGSWSKRSFAHAYETGGMRRAHLRGRDNVLKRMLIHVGGFNLSLVMRKLLGKGTPRGLQGLSAEDLLLLLRFWVAVLAGAAEESASTPMFMSSHAVPSRLF